MATFYFRHFVFYVTVIMVHNYEVNNQMSEQIPSMLVTLTVFNTSVAIYFNDLKQHDIKKHKNILKNKNKNIYASWTSQLNVCSIV